MSVIEEHPENIENIVIESDPEPENQPQEIPNGLYFFWKNSSLI